MQPAARVGYGGSGMKWIPVMPYMDTRYRETSHGMYAARGSAFIGGRRLFGMIYVKIPKIDR